MTAIRLDTICDRVRALGGYPNSRVFTNAVLTPWVNSAIGVDYCGLLDEHQAGWRDTTAPGVTVAGTATVSLPTGAISIRRVDIKIDGDWIALSKFNSGVADSYAATGKPRDYLHVGASGIELFPTPDAAYELRFRYVPSFTPLAADSDTFDFPNGWEELVVHIVLLRCLKRERRDATDLLIDIGRLTDSIVRASGRKDTSGPAYLPNPRARHRGWRFR